MRLLEVLKTNKGCKNRKIGKAEKWKKITYGTGILVPSSRLTSTRKKKTGDVKEGRTVENIPREDSIVAIGKKTKRQKYSCYKMR